MKNNTPSISVFKKGQTVLMGSTSFGIYGRIVEVVPKDPLPIKVDANMGSIFELSLDDYEINWKLLNK